MTAETIQRRKVFKGGNYSRKYGTFKNFKKFSVHKAKFYRWMKKIDKNVVTKMFEKESVDYQTRGKLKLTKKNSLNRR